jgi:hypothetical protein
VAGEIDLYIADKTGKTIGRAGAGFKTAPEINYLISGNFERASLIFSSGYS